MRTLFWTMALCYLALGVMQAQNTDRTQKPDPAPAHETMMLTGCLVSGSEPDTYKLVVTMPTNAAESQPRAAGTSGTRVEYEVKPEARLDAAGVGAIELKGFVGHQVEVTARPVAEPPAAPSKPGGAVQTDAATEKPAEPKMEKLTVTAIKQVLATCQ